MSSRDLKDCVDELQLKVPQIIDEYNKTYPGRELRVICTLRNTQEQQNLYAVGRTIPPLGPNYWLTKVDGVKKFSKHNPDPIQPLSKAVDVGVFIGGKYIREDSYYYGLLELARKNLLVSGLDFRESGLTLVQLLHDGHFHDIPHIEVKGPIYEPQGV
jgi:hypothetical protein